MDFHSGVLFVLLVKTKKYDTISYRYNKTTSFFVNVVKGARKMWIFLQTMIDTPPVKRPIDEGWIKQIADGDMQALHLLYDAIHCNVYAFAYSLVQNKSDAEDILQETFVLCFRHVKLTKPKFLKFLYRRFAGCRCRELRLSQLCLLLPRFLFQWESVD